jgi:hypothetical protein
MRCIASCEAFQRAGKSTQPALPILPEKGVSDTEVRQLLETIDDILEEFDRPTRFSVYKNTFLETFMQKVDDCTTQRPLHPGKSPTCPELLLPLHPLPIVPMTQNISLTAMSTSNTSWILSVYEKTLQQL